jgi:hypothetical protein
MTDVEGWEFRIAKLELAPGDVLVVKGPTPPEWRAMSAIVPPGVRLLIIPPEVELSVLTRAEIEEKANG